MDKDDPGTIYVASTSNAEPPDPDPSSPQHVQSFSDQSEEEGKDTVTAILKLYKAAGVKYTEEDFSHQTDTDTSTAVIKFYAAGTPFFTKDVIRQFAESADSTPPKKTIVVRGVDGREVECAVKIRNRKKLNGEM